MKTLFALLLLLPYSSYAQGGDAAGVFGLHLFFNEKEAIDVLTLKRTPQGQLAGDMHVPNDFDAAVINIEESADSVSFDLPVPKNSSRPEDLMFHYVGRFFDSAKKDELTGFVTLKGEKDFVASFVAFRRKAQ